MAENATPFLAPWLGFYTVVGSSAAALTGLMFVVITLVTRENAQRSHDGVSTFSTPTVIHFSAALLVSAIAIAPWPSTIAPAVLLVLAGLFGVAYMLRILLRTKRLSAYTPDLEDWISYTILPLIAYGAILGAGLALPNAAPGALFACAAGAVSLIFIGIHNAWDVVTFITIGPAGKPPDSSSTE